MDALGLKENLVRLVITYVTDKVARNALLIEIENDTRLSSKAKYYMYRLGPYLQKISSEDIKIIKDINYYFI